MSRHLPFIAYPAINTLAVTGDRRTAAVVAADGTIQWMCLPDYDGHPIFGALLDAQRGGYWRVGPSVPNTGNQSYLDDTAAVVTTWAQDEWALELTDLMPWPQEKRPSGDEGRRVILRRIRCTLGQVTCVMRLCPRANYDAPASVTATQGGHLLKVGDHTLGLWASFPVTAGAEDVTAELHMTKGDEQWVALGLGESPADWTTERTRRVFDETATYWHDWLGGLDYRGPHARHMERSGVIIHLLGYAPNGSMVAAPTSSLPERIGGDRNYDYRYAWVRDASLSVAGLSLLGDRQTATRYLDWLASLQSTTAMPLQVAYHISGGLELRQHTRDELAGYRGSKPVLVGNHAFNQIQHGALGYLADCMLIHLDNGGEWKEEYWHLIERTANYVAEHWREPDSGIWELAQQEQFVGSKVMCWVVLDRALTIAKRTGNADADDDHASWRRERDAIRAQVLTEGWSEDQRSFVQRYGSDALDASLLLIPMMGFLPPNDPRVKETVDRIVETLAIDGLIYRFQPLETPSSEDMPLGQFEGAFLPCCFWLATVYAMAGRVEEAATTLERVERLSNVSGLFAEEADARNGEMLGNYPLLFSQVEYVRTVMALANARDAIRSREQ